MNLEEYVKTLAERIMGPSIISGNKNGQIDKMSGNVQSVE